MAPNGRAQEKVISAALSDAGMSIGDVDYMQDPIVNKVDLEDSRLFLESIVDLTRIMTFPNSTYMLGEFLQAQLYVVEENCGNMAKAG